jgi:hypothetical protein
MPLLNIPLGHGIKFSAVVFTPLGKAHGASIFSGAWKQHSKPVSKEVFVSCLAFKTKDAASWHG